MHNDEDQFNKALQQALTLGRRCTSAPMPNLSHLKLSDYNNVYEPSEDTFLLLDALQYDFENDNVPFPCKNPIVTFEIGCGTGVNTVFLSNLLSCSSMHYVTDINQYAIDTTLKTALMNNVLNIEAVQCDLASPFLPKLNGLVDILLFNPPYVPTPNEEVGSDGIEASWAGGDDGRVVIDRALEQIARLMRFPGGCAYMVVVDENRPGEIGGIMWERYGVVVTPVLSRRARNEWLTILKMVPSKNINL